VIVVSTELAKEDETMGHGIGTAGADDGYQGPQAAQTVDPVTEELSALAFQIADLEDAAQNAEDREQLGKASALRAKIRPLNDRFNELRSQLAAQRAVQS
jgi:hypothetical protein